MQHELKSASYANDSDKGIRKQQHQYRHSSTKAHDKVREHLSTGETINNEAKNGKIREMAKDELNR